MSKWWEGFDWRFIQTNLREIDMADIDAKQYVSDMKLFHANIAMINAAGIIASYPTKLKYHYQSPYLTGDSMQQIIAECHKEGIKVIARTDFSKIRVPIYKEHPEWAYRTVTGDIVNYEGDVHACINGGYQSEYALEIIRECITQNDFDGIFFNMGGYQVRDYSFVYHGICHCDACKKKFKEMYGLPLPHKEDMSDPVFRKYRVFRNITAAAHNEKVARFIKSIRPDILVNADTWTETSGMIRQESNTALDRALPHWQYSGSENTKWVRGSYPNFISSNCTVDFIDFPTRHTTVSPTQQETRLWQNLANAGHLDYYLIGRIDNHKDKSGYKGIIRVFEYHEKHQALYRDNVSTADIAMITAPHWGGFGGDGAEAAGLYRMLAENHYLFDVVLQDRLSYIDLSKYRLLVLPSLVNLSDAEAQAIDAFVKDGGKLLCTGRTGFADGEAEARPKPALASLGINKIDIVQDARGGYFELSPADHDTFKRFDGIELVYIDGDYVYASYEKDALPLISMIPPQPFGPPERCYPLYPAGKNSAAVRHPYGKGEAVYIPWFPGKLFHRQGYPNTMQLVADLLENVLGMQPVKTDLPPMVEVTLVSDRAASFHLLQFVNQTGHFGNSFYPPVTLPHAAVTVPLSRKPSKVSSLLNGKAVPFSYEDGKLSVEIADLGIFEALYIEG